MRPPAFLLCKFHVWTAHRLERWIDWHLAEARRIADDYRRRLGICR